MIKSEGTRAFKLFRLFFAAAISFSCPFLYGQDELNTRNPSLSIQDSIRQVYENNKTSVVMVKGGHTLQGGQIDFITGSGFLASKEGHIITSAIVTCNASPILVEWDGVYLEAESVGFDPITNLSVIKVKNDFASRNASFVSVSSQSQIAPIACPIVLISREFGLPSSPRLGIITGHDIDFGDIILPAFYLRTDIPSYKGSVGAPAFDFDGNFVGMLVAGLPDMNSSYLIPAKAVARIRDDIVVCGESVYGWFGLGAIDGDDTKKSQVKINVVIKKSPADKAGFLVGDIILEVNGAKIANNRQLRNITFYIRPGETARFKVLRGTEIMNLELLVEKMDSDVIKAAATKINPKDSDNKSKENSEKSEESTAPQ